MRILYKDHCCILLWPGVGNSLQKTSQLISMNNWTYYIAFWSLTCGVFWSSLLPIEALVPLRRCLRRACLSGLEVPRRPCKRRRSFQLCTRCKTRRSRRIWCKARSGTGPRPSALTQSTYWKKFRGMVTSVFFSCLLSWMNRYTKHKWFPEKKQELPWVLLCCFLDTYLKVCREIKYQCIAVDIPGKADDVREVDCDQREGFWDDRNAVRQLLGDRLWKHTME